MEEELTKGCVLPRDWLLGISSSSTALKLQTIIDEYHLMKRDRHQHIVYPRHYFAWFCRRKLRMTYCHIGELLGRDHATVIHAEKTVDAMIKYKDRTFEQYTIEIKQKLNEIYESTRQDP